MKETLRQVKKYYIMKTTRGGLLNDIMQILTIRGCHAILNRWEPDAKADSQKRLNENNLDVPQPGDIFWCQMPLTKEQLEKVEESHRIRPYLITEVKDTYVTAYYCSSSEMKRIPHNEQYLIKHNEFYCNRDTYVNLHTLHTIPYENLRGFYFAIDATCFHMIQEQRRQCEISLEQPVPENLQEGFVIIAYQHYYLIYQHDHTNYYGALLKRYEPTMEIHSTDILTCIFYQIYLVDFEYARQFSLAMRFSPIAVCPQKQVEDILAMRKQKKQSKSLPKSQINPSIIRKAYYDYTPGTILLMPPDENYLYLFS